MSANVRGGPVVAHAQAFADALLAGGLATSFGTYKSPPPSDHPFYAIDVFVPTTDRVPGDVICAYAIKHFDRFGLKYLIYRRHIWNPSISRTWRLMEDRGNPTANHVDHVHVSFQPTVSAPAPTPAPTEDNDMLIAWITEPTGFTAYLVAGGVRAFIATGDELNRLKTAGVREVLGESSWLAKLPKGA